MKRIAKFYKVSFEQFLEGLKDCLPNDYTSDEVLEYARNLYDNIKLPVRATSGSAGYDFFTPYNFTLPPNKTIKIPTIGIKRA